MRGIHNKARALASEEWRSSLYSLRNIQIATGGDNPNPFEGWVRSVRVCGFAALDIGCNIPTIARTQRDVRLDGRDNYCAVLQLAGASAVSQNDQDVKLAAGDIILLDSTRPMTLFHQGLVKQLCVCLPRSTVISQLGFEPRGGMWSRGTLAGNVLFQMLRGALQDEAACMRSEWYMQLAAYDLLGALLTPSDAPSRSRYSDKLFDRIRGMIQERFAEAGLAPAAVAADAGISLRYLQSLFTARGTTCSHFIQSIRLAHAERLLVRRALQDGQRPLYEIAYACGFRDYAYFARKFHERFGHAPSAHSAMGKVISKDA